MGAWLLLSSCAVYKPLSMESDISTGQLQDRFFIASDNIALPLTRYTVKNPKAIVIAVHGFNDYRNSFASFAQFAQTQNMTTIAYDQRGFGENKNPGKWAGGDVMAADLRSIIQAVKSQNPQIPVYVLGDSMGGAVTILASAKNPPPPLAGVILVAPAVWARSTMNPLQVAALWFTAHTMPWLSLGGKGLGIVPSDNNAMLRALSADPLVLKESRTDGLYGMTDLMDAALLASSTIELPTLIVYGANDQIIPKSALRAMTAILPVRNNWQFIWYDRGYHMLLRDLQAENVWRDIVEWINGKGQIATPIGRAFNQENRKQIPVF